MRVIDISVPNGPGQHVYPGDPQPRIEQVKAIRKGDVCNISLLTMGSHTGTHVDAPYHFIDGGPRLGDVPLDRMVGEALVVDLRGRSPIDAAALAEAPIRRGDILICRTDNSERWAAAAFQRDFTYVTLDAATLLVERGVRAIGFDYLSIEAFGSSEFPVHLCLLGAGVFIIEGLDLPQVAAGPLPLVCRHCGSRTSTAPGARRASSPDGLARGLAPRHRDDLTGACDVAAALLPWPGGIAVYRTAGGSAGTASPRGARRATRRSHAAPADAARCVRTALAPLVGAESGILLKRSTGLRGRSARRSRRARRARGAEALRFTGHSRGRPDDHRREAHRRYPATNRLRSRSTQSRA
jgi:arylformamidase